MLVGLRSQPTTQSRTPAQQVTLCCPVLQFRTSNQQLPHSSSTYQTDLPFTPLTRVSSEDLTHRDLRGWHTLSLVSPTVPSSPSKYCATRAARSHTMVTGAMWPIKTRRYGRGYVSLARVCGSSPSTPTPRATSRHLQRHLAKWQTMYIK